MPSPLTTAVVGTDYSQSVAASPSGSYSYSIITGSLPTGLTLNSTTGLLSGRPTVTGAYNFTVRAQWTGGCGGQQTYTLIVNCPSIVVGPGSLSAGAVGAAYSATFLATPAASYSFTVTTGALPMGLSLNSSTGVLSGTPTVSGSFTFTITAKAFGNCAGSKAYTLAISGGGVSCPTITLPELPSGQAGQSYSQSVTASPSGSYSYTVIAGSLPLGLTLYGNVGLVYGYPTAVGIYNFTITATGANGCAGNKSYSLIINGRQDLRKNE